MAIAELLQYILRIILRVGIITLPKEVYIFVAKLNKVGYNAKRYFTQREEVS
jgi:hypothetical protein